VTDGRQTLSNSRIWTQEGPVRLLHLPRHFALHSFDFLDFQEFEPFGTRRATIWIAPEHGCVRRVDTL
jgi:hypothetical protein